MTLGASEPVRSRTGECRVAALLAGTTYIRGRIGPGRLWSLTASPATGVVVGSRRWAAGSCTSLLMGRMHAYPKGRYGKTMLAERLPGLLPALSLEEALEVTAVHSVAGALPEGQPLVQVPPFQDPHHTATVASIVGGGSGVARPGAPSLARPSV